jgi:phosphoglycolate phosphatase-like HAD superfamily hydrolase
MFLYTEQRPRLVAAPVEQTSAVQTKEERSGLELKLVLAFPGKTESQARTGESEVLRELEREKARYEIEYVQSSALLNHLKTLPRTELRNAIPTAAPDPALDKLLQNLAEAEQRYASLTHSDLGRDHPDVVRLAALIKKVNQQIEERIDGVMAGLASVAAAKESALKELSEQIAKGKHALTVGDSKTAPGHDPGYAEELPLFSGGGKLWVLKRPLSTLVWIDRIEVAETLGGCQIRISCKPDSAKELERVTRENIGRQLALVHRGRILTAPVIRDAITGKDLVITGDFTKDEAKEVAEELRGNSKSF